MCIFAIFVNKSNFKTYYSRNAWAVPPCQQLLYNQHINSFFTPCIIDCTIMARHTRQNTISHSFLKDRFLEKCSLLSQFLLSQQFIILTLVPKICTFLQYLPINRILRHIQDNVGEKTFLMILV